ncbi:hypothetical protein APX81_17805 [Escherichia coli]|nr:hypothetical protein [Escherichia coli]EEW6032043.1 hypothetical protein [Escherichia coli]EFN9261619.1 hypothetical protein [Escherichia coli]KIH08752.1 hypothetical protein PU13_26260 [Escherichia coli]PAZ22516.1 hypothetical protein APU33_28095 [Escherichia coli]
MKHVNMEKVTIRFRENYKWAVLLFWQIAEFIMKQNKIVVAEDICRELRLSRLKVEEALSLIVRYDKKIIDCRRHVLYRPFRQIGYEIVYMADTPAMLEKVKITCNA